MEDNSVMGAQFSINQTTNNYAKVAFNANELPSQGIEHTNGFFRRWLIVPFEQTITEEEKDPDLAHKITSAESEGVINWILGGMRRLRDQRKFSHCQKSDNAVRCYQQESDSTALFFDDENYQSSFDYKISKKAVYYRYREYCSEAGYRALGKVKFNQRLKTLHKIEDGKDGAQGHYWHMTQGE